jgi:protein-tyrosine phosphatase
MLIFEEAFEEIAADEALWDAQFAATDAAKLDALIASVEAEINEGKTLPMFDERGEFIESNKFKDNQSILEALWPGKLAISSRPRGGDWLEDEVRSWQHRDFEVIVSLLTDDERVDLNLEDEAKFCKIHGLQYLAFPIVDRSVPPSQKATLNFLKKLDQALAEGKNVLIHCRQGIGRSALMAICLLVLAGEEPEAAIQRVSTARGVSAPETPEQKKWVIEFGEKLAAPLLN